MASLAEINVRIGARIEGLQKGLKSAERSLRRTGRQLSSLGSELTTTISAPLALLGGAAIKTAGDFEALEKALASQLGTAEAARVEVEKLRKEALKPGLGFEQAVRGSVKLQAVGFSADEARESLSAFGNAIALAGGSANDLDGVALALTQIASKGKISAEEINQLAERVPQVRKAISDVFGTADTEALQKLGVEAKDFINAVTKEIGKLPPATSGIKNSLENTGIAIQTFLARIGTEINDAFDIGNAAERFSNFLNELADRFAALDDGTKRFIVTAGGILVVLGPAVKVLGALYNTYAQVVTVFQGSLNVIKNLTGRVLESVKAFQALSVAQKATIAGLGLAALGLAIGIYANLAEKSEEAARAQRNVREATKEAAAEIGREEYATKQLFNVLKDTNASTNERQRALDELKAKYPSYLGNLDAEKLKLGDIEIAQKKVNEELTKSIAARIQNQKQEEIAARIAEKRLRITELQSGAEAEVSEARRVNTGELVKFGSISNAVINELQQDIKILGDESNLLSETFNKTFGTESPITNKSRGIGGGTTLEDLKLRLSRVTKGSQDWKDTLAEILKIQPDFKIVTDSSSDSVATFEQELQKLQETLATLPKRSEEYYDTLKKIADLQERIAFIDRPAEDVPQQVQQGAGVIQPIQFTTDANQTEELGKQLQDIYAQISSNLPSLDITPFQNYNAELERANNLYLAFGDGTAYLNDQILATQNAITQAIENGWLPQSEAVQALLEDYRNLTEQQNRFNENQELALDAANAFARTFASATKQGESALKSLAKAAVAAAKEIINTLLARAIARFIEKAIEEYGVAGLVVGALGGALVTGVFNAAVPEFANGGVVDSPTLALVGEYPGAKSNPEIIAPEDKLTKIFKENQSDGMGRVAVEDIVIEGDKLRIVLDEANRRYSRYGG